MKRTHTVAVSSLFALAAACVSPGTPVPVSGTPADVTTLVGEWYGEYSAPDAGRSGSIVFTLAAVGDTARGDVVMVPVGLGRPLHPAHDDPEERYLMRPPQTLTISFIVVEGEQVSGRLDRYHDPEFDCSRVAQFVGIARADTIAGTFVSWAAAPHPAIRGTWRMVRTRP
jgi:hypothetical protein